MTTTTSQVGAGRPALEPIPRSVWRVAGVVVFGAVMGMLDTSLANVGLDTIATDLHADLAAAQWIASGYLLALAVTLPLCGWLGRRVGHDRLWLGALAAFTVSSVLCALAPTMCWLIALRVLQGLAAGFLIPAGQTLIGQAAGPQRLGRVMSVVGIAVVGAPAIGPTVGGLLLEHLGWQWLFLVNIPIGLVAFVLGLRVLPASPRGARTPFDLPGFVLVGAGLSLTVFGLGEFGSRGSFAAPTVWVSVAAGVLALGLFAWRSLGRPGALLDIGLFRDPVFAAANVVNFFGGAALFGGMLLLPLYFQILRGEGLVATGVLLFGFGFGGVLALPVGGWLTDRFGGGAVSVVGNLVAAAVTVPFALAGADLSLPAVEALLFVRGIATGLVGVPAVAAAYAAVRPDQLPDAASLVNIGGRVGGSIGAALFAVVLYRAQAAGLPAATGFAHAFWWLVAGTLVAASASILLWRKEAGR
ncbi:DHA2 family efflux MFS transporter permease subunit [Nocardia thailandica]|uniref:DHA2 family efflux MFS transporter permease subunit n=1 Tax=Nocardia thailandica TaxID=257275 RepID=UPI0002D952A2|nr:DHA2 family efflux MFS transporter permease subunit [Nocardia thailandica]